MTIIFANKIAESDTHEDPVKSLKDAIAFDAADWAESRGMAWVYGIALGWDDEDDADTDAMSEIAARFGWDDNAVARLRRLHSAFQAMS